MKKNKKIIFIIWGLFISVSVIGLLIILLLALQPKQSPQSFNQPVEDKPIQSSSQQEQETYNNIINKIGKEVDELTKPRQKINYRKDGKTIFYIETFDSQTGKKIKEDTYKADGKTLDYIWIFSPQTGEKIKSENYSADGKSINYIEEFNPTTGNIIKTISYKPDNYIKEYNSQSKLTKKTIYFDDGKTINYIEEYDPQTDLKIQNTVYNKEGKIVKIIKNKPSKDYVVEEFNPTTGNKNQETYYKSDGTLEKVRYF
uniref:DUF2963 domain-containing protein n=2 Tax=Paulownia witches'-broom phytoplasma TaxID=39647 RepID=B1N8W7_9MOLU|nr:hypothetical protein [Paulownia witches'-broom phytoplasma]